MRIIDQLFNPVITRLLCKTGAAAAWIAALVFRRNLEAEWQMLRTSGVVSTGPTAAPSNPAGWFDLLQQHPLLGLTFLSFFDLVNLILVAFLFLAVTLTLWKTHPAASLLAGFLAVAAVTGYALTNQALHLLAMSRAYASAPEPQRAALLSAAQTLLAVHRSNNFSGGGLYPSFFLISAAGLILSIIMLSGFRFGKRAAVTGMLANCLGLAYYPVLFLTPAFTWLPLSLSAVFLLAWYLMLGRRLWSFDPRGAQVPARNNRQPGSLVQIVP